MIPSTLLNRLQGALVAMLVVVIGLEWLIYSPGVQSQYKSVAVSVPAVQTGSGFTDIAIHIDNASAAEPVRFAALPLSAVALPLTAIFVYVDARYPTANVGPTAVQGVYDHLSAELAIRKFTVPVIAISASTLKDLLSDTPMAPQRAVVLMAGVLPAIVFSTTVDLVSPWVRSGGLVIWGGGTLGFWSGTAGRPLTQSSALGKPGTEELLGPGVVVYPSSSYRIGTTPTELASALGIAFKFTSAGVARLQVLTRGGHCLGWLSGPYCSVSYLPVGRGGYLIFAGEIVDEASVARDMAELIIPPIWAAATELVAIKDYVPPSQTPSQNIEWRIPFGTPSGLLLIAFDPSLDSGFFQSFVVRR